MIPKVVRNAAYGGPMDLSIVIPVYNEVHKVVRDIEAAAEFLLANRLTGEIIVADDGSTDHTAVAARAAKVPSGIALKVLELPHRGKGWVVRSGIMVSSGDSVMFADSGRCVPFEDALLGLALLREGGADIANGSRKMPSSIIAFPHSFHRRVLSWLFRRAVLIYLSLPRNLTDTQCGFKVYRGDVARELYGLCQTDGFMIDLEVLMRAQAQRYVVKEFPVHWTCDRDSRLKPRLILLRTISELRAVKELVAEATTQRKQEALMVLTRGHDC